MGVQFKKDHYNERARKEGYRARSIYKLEELDKKFSLFKRGQAIVDLGAAPGSWTQYLAQVVGRQGIIISLDLQEIAPGLPSQVTVLQGDAFEMPPAELQELAGRPITALVSDMAPKTSGVRQVDHLRSVALCERAIEMADRVLSPGGTLVMKLFQGGDTSQLLKSLRTRYGKVRVFKPKSTKQASVETFAVSTEYKGSPLETEPELSLPKAVPGYDPFEDM